MAGQAAKKAAKAEASTASLYFPIIVAVNTLYICFRVLYNFRTFGRWQAFGLLVTSGAYYICYQGLVEAARMGVTGGTYFDILAVCLAGQAVSTFSSYGVYIYALIPGYYASLLIYYIVGKVATWMSSQQLENTEESSAKELKRQAKKERKAARGPKIRAR